MADDDKNKDKEGQEGNEDRDETFYSDLHEGREEDLEPEEYAEEAKEQRGSSKKDAEEMEEGTE